MLTDYNNKQIKSYKKKELTEPEVKIRNKIRDFLNKNKDSYVLDRFYRLYQEISGKV